MTKIKDDMTGKDIEVIADVIIIGGGIAGLAEVDELAKQDATSALFEKRETLMAGASATNPGRAGLGFHYADIETGKTYLRETINFIKKYKKETGIDFRLGSDKYLETDPQRKGRYFIPETSLVPGDKLIEIYIKLRTSYAALIAEDQENKIYGEPEDFFKMLSQADYRNDVSRNDITFAIETKEQLLDVPKFRAHLVKTAKQHEKNNKTKLFTGANVTSIEQTSDAKYFIVTVEHEGKIKKYAAPEIINASWESTDKLNQTVGISMQQPGYDLLLAYNITEEKAKTLSKGNPVAIKYPDGTIKIYGNTDGKKWAFTNANENAFSRVKFPKLTSTILLKKDAVPVYVREEIASKKSHTPTPFRTNRIKIIAEVLLPDTLTNSPCMFFAIGPFCMFSNMQNGRGLITYAPETNYVKSDKVSLTPTEEAKLHEGFTPEEADELGKKIINGVSKFIPEMKHAALIAVYGGVVKTYGGVELCDPSSDFHKRRELGIQELAIDMLEISCMKLMYGRENAEQACAYRTIFKKTKQEIEKMSATIATAAPASYTKSLMTNFFNTHLKRYSTTKDILANERKEKTLTDIKHTVELKNIAMEELRRTSLPLNKRPAPI